MNYKIIVLIAFIGLIIMPTVSAEFNTTFGTVVAPNAVTNSTRPYVYSFNISTGSGTNNATHIYANGASFYFNFVNSTHVNTNINVTGDNTTVLPIWFKKIDSGVAQVYVNVTINFSQVQTYSGGSNYTYNNTLGGERTFRFFDDFEGASVDSVKWTTSGSPTISSGSLYLDNIEYIYTKKTFNLGNASGYKAKFGSGGTNLYMGYSTSGASHTDWVVFISNIVAGKINGRTRTGAGVVTDTASLGDVNVYYELEAGWLSGAANFTANTTRLTSTTNIPSTAVPIQIASEAAGDTLYVDYVYSRDYIFPEPSWDTWGSTETLYPTISTWTNNYTSDTSLSISKLTGNTPVNFSVTVTGASYFNWTVDDVLQADNTSYFNQNFPVAGTYLVNFSAMNTTKNRFANISWSVTASNYTLELLTPANTSTGVAIPVSLTWRQWPNSGATHTYYVSTDAQFINTVASGTDTPTDENYAVSVSLSSSTQYYWRVWNGTAYSSIFEFTTAAPTVTPGRLNVTVLDEVNLTTVATFQAAIYNNSYYLVKSATGGWANFSASEISSGEYFLTITPNSSYAARSILVTSPTNATVYVPATTNTIDTVAFYLLDYTNKFPWGTSYLSVTKNNSVMHSSYFDADAKVAVNLIRGNSYSINVYNGDNTQNWGNYISTGSGNVEVVVMNIGVNKTLYVPFTYALTWTNSNITLSWNDAESVLSSLNYTIQKGDSKTLVHNLITSVRYGNSEYIVTNTSDSYYVFVTAQTTQGWKNQTYVIDYRAGTARPDLGLAFGPWSYGGMTVPTWVKNAFAVISLMMLAGSFGAMHRGEGAIITGIMSVLFWYWDWLEAPSAGVGFLASLLLFAILYHLESKRRSGGAYS